MKRKLLQALLIAFILLPISVGAADNFNISRLSGSDRYKTAIEVAETTYKASDYAIVASGENFPDALAGGPLAISLKAPIYLTDKAELPKEVMASIIKLKVKKVIILGSTGSVSKNVESALASVTSVERLGGENRFETAAMIAKKVRDFTGVIDIAIASGRSFPDALSANSLLGQKGIPILLTEKESLPSESRNFYDNEDIGKVYVLGGQGTINDTALKGLANITRVQGEDRYETSIELAKLAFSKSKGVILVSGESFPDALSASILTTSLNAPLVLTAKGKLPTSVGNYLKAVNPSDVYIIGGNGTVSPDVVQNIIDVLSGNTNAKPDFKNNSYQDKYAKDIIESINAVRNKNGKYKLSWSDDLYKAAKIRAKEIATKLSHTRPDGSKYNELDKAIKGEIIAQINADPEKVVDILMQTRGQSQTILLERSDFKGIGAACWVNENGKAYWAIIFGTMN